MVPPRKAGGPPDLRTRVRRAPRGRPVLRIGRRQFLVTALGAAGELAALAGAGYIGYRLPRSVAAAAATAARGQVLRFVSRPDLSPPAVTVTRSPAFLSGPGAAAAPRYILLSPKGYNTTGPGQPGLMIVDTTGNLVWFRPLPSPASAPFDLQVQRYHGQPVLTWWAGTVVSVYGEGMGYLADAAYRTIATIRAGNGLQVDLHELNLTPQGTALITAYRTADADLSALGGPARGQVLACQAQEIDIASGRMLFAWDSLDHVPLTESQQPLPSGPNDGPYDYFHMNSVALAPDGDLLISSRNTWTIYKVSRKGGQIVWRLGGKASDFRRGPGAAFYWQHHVRALGGGRISIFDDGASPPEEPQSRGIVLSVDETSKQARLLAQYTNPARLLADNQGSVQVMSDGRVFVGWGDQPYFSEFAADGTMLLDGRLPADDQSYRAFTADWAARPVDQPAVAVQSSTAGGVTLYASWNGATELAGWQALAGPSAETLAIAARARRTGFETAIAVNSSGPYFAAVALDAAGRQIGRSTSIRLSA